MLILCDFARLGTADAVYDYLTEELRFPEQVTARPASPEDLWEIEDVLREYCALFSLQYEVVANAPFTVVTPDSANPYRQMYVAN